MSRLKNELDKFWKWASVSSSEYSELPVDKEWETDYPSWEKIYDSVESELNRKQPKNISHEVIQNLLEAMAIDNECENVLDMIEGNREVSSIIIQVGASHSQPHARWQVAELIKRIGDIKNITILVNMVCNDKDKYVQRRALLALGELDEAEAKRCAKKKMNDEDPLLRKISYNILQSTT